MTHSTGSTCREERLRLALRVGRTATWEWDLSTGHVLRSEAANELLGLSSGPATEFQERIHPDDRERHRTALKTAVENGSPYDAELRFLKADGSTIWIHDQAQLYTGPQGQRLLIGTVAGISARKAAEEELRRSEERLKDFAEIGSDWFWEMDADHRYVMATGRLAVADVIGRTRWDLAGADPTSPEWKEHISLHQARLPFRHFEHKVRLNGQTYHLSTSGRPVFDEGGIFQGYRGVTADITARKKAEHLAAEKAAVLEATLENMNQGLMVLDKEGRVALFNQRVLDLLDLPSGLLSARPRLEEVRDYLERRGESTPPECAFLQMGQGQDFLSDPPVYERTRQNGTIIEVRSARLPSGGAIRTYTDTTARRLPEAELRESAERLSLATKATADAIWDWNLDQDLVCRNEAIQTLFGYPPEAVESTLRWWKDRLHPEDRERVVSSIQAAIHCDGSRWSDEYRFRRADGSFAYVLDRGHLMRDAQGRPLRMVGAMQDLTERKATEQALRDSEARYRLLADNTSDIVIRGDLEAVRLYVSPASFSILGFRAEELIGTRPTEFVHPDDEAGLRAKLTALARGEVDYAWNIHRFRHKNGSWVWVEVTFRLVRNEAGEPQEVVSAVRDISERVQLEAQLRQSQKMEALGQLTGGISHDFNNLLTVILGNADMMVEAATDPRLRELAEQIQAAAERGSDLNQKLLAFGRRQSLRPTLVNLDEAVLSLSDLLKRAIGEHIDLKTEASGGRAVAVADRTQLESALLNLSVNARDAMQDGGTLTIATSEVAAPSGEAEYVQIKVTDTGTGIPPEALEHVFEPFFTTKEVGKGTGLGPAMVYGFAQQSGGHVHIESKVGEGTSVTIVLPAAKDLRRSDRTRVSGPAPLPGGTETVLVVEDSAGVRRYATSTLLSLGYQVLEAPDGEAALEILRENDAVRLLFTDVVLPKGIDGVELARRAQAMRPGLKVLLTSGYSEDVFRRQGRPGADAPLIQKPYRRAALADAIRDVLGGKEAGERPPISREMRMAEPHAG